MINIYLLDAQRIYAGPAQHNPLHPLPGPCTLIAPPDTTGTEVAQWTGSGWQVLQERPTPPVAPIAQRRAEAWERIKAERDRRRFDGGAKVGGNWFLSTQQAVGEYSALVLMGSSFPPGAVLRAGWRTMVPGVTVDMTAALAAQILGSGFQAIAAIDDAAQAHRAAMQASDAPESYSITSGWPVSIGDAL
jgi:hypothetical protein